MNSDLFETIGFSGERGQIMTINITKSFLPPFETYSAYLKKIWESNWLTNNGPLLQELEQRLKEYLGVKHLFIVSNGTISLQIAIKVLNLTGEIITTPFSYVATVSSIVWENCVPVFVDIDPETLCLDPRNIEAAITPKTQAIMGVHVYGNPCDVLEIEKIATKHNLKVIYDAAHAFGVKLNGKSVLNYGDVSSLSFHATKLFHTVEGGALITDSNELAHKINYARHNGHKSPEEFYGLGINAKNSEFHAAMGLSILPSVQRIIRKRKSVCELYDAYFAGTNLRRPVIPENVEYNYAYYPVILESEAQLLRVRERLVENDIHPRRYFYPPLNTLNYVTFRETKMATDISSRVLSLPLYPDLPEEDVRRIAGLVLEEL